MVVNDGKASRLACGLALAGALALSAIARGEAAVTVTWDLTAPPSANDATSWLLTKPDNTPAPAIDRFLGHSATYASGGFNLVVNAYYVLPSALADFQTAFLHRAATNGALGVCDGAALNAQQTATICGGGDTTVIDGIGNIDILRLTLPMPGALSGASLRLFRNADSYRVYCSDGPTIDLGDASAVVASGAGPAGALTLQLGSGTCDKEYVFITPDAQDGTPGPDRGFRVSEVVVTLDETPTDTPPTAQQQLLAIAAPSALSLLPTWLLALGLLAAWAGRRAWARS